MAGICPFADILVPANSRHLSTPEDGQEPELVQVVVKPGELHTRCMMRALEGPAA